MFEKTKTVQAKIVDDTSRYGGTGYGFGRSPNGCWQTVYIGCEAATTGNAPLIADRQTEFPSLDRILHSMQRGKNIYRPN